MPKQSSKPKRRPNKLADINPLAAVIIAQATGEAAVPQETPTPEPGMNGKDLAAVSLGRRGGLKGGPARAKKLSAKKRAEIAKKAARARWGR